MFTETDAIDVARKFHENAGLSAEIFGSVARSGTGRDIDLIVIVDEGTFQAFVSDVRRRNEGRNAFDVYGKTRQRFFAADEATNGMIGDVVFSNLRGIVRRHDNLDIFLFPENWRHRLDEIQRALPNRDPNFMKNIARDARKVI